MNNLTHSIARIAADTPQPGWKIRAGWFSGAGIEKQQREAYERIAGLSS